jgi:hypothetical protein
MACKVRRSDNRLERNVIIELGSCRRRFFFTRTQHLNQTLALRQKLVVSHDGYAVEPAIEPMQCAQLLVLPIVRTTDDDHRSRVIRNDLRMVTKTCGSFFVKHVEIPMTLAEGSGNVGGKVVVAVSLVP